MSYHLYSTPQQIKRLIIEEPNLKSQDTHELRLRPSKSPLERQSKTNLNIKYPPKTEPIEDLGTKISKLSLNISQNQKISNLIMTQKSSITPLSANRQSSNTPLNRQASQIIQMKKVTFDRQEGSEKKKLSIFQPLPPQKQNIAFKLFSKQDYQEDPPQEEDEMINFYELAQLQALQQKKIPQRKSKTYLFYHKKNQKNKRQIQQKIEQREERQAKLIEKNLQIEQQILQIQEEIAQSLKIKQKKELLSDLFTHTPLPINLPISHNELIVELKDIQILSQNPLGKGGFGEVFKCTYKGQFFATKISEVPWDQLSQLLAESIVQYFCQHKNLVRMEAIAFENRGSQVKVYFVMELMSIDLRKLIFNEKKKFSLKQKTNILIDVLEGLVALHENDYAHCDLKMPNILLDDAFTAKITDFGITKSLKLGQTNKTSLKGVSERISSYEYLVEQKISTKGDIWSFGILMYELISEGLAWNHLSGPQTVVKVSMKTPFFNYNSRVNIEFFDYLIEKCLNYEYKERPSAQSLLQEIMDYKLNNFV